MKSLLLTVCGTLAALSLSAQTFVSTTASNKNVVLEEFTGIKCTFCPDGHLRAKQFSDANPGRVVLVNIHVGSFAAPGTGQPDFRTSFGTAIDNQANVAGYPAGTINRRTFSNTGPSSNPTGTGQSDCATCTAMSRGYWSTVGATVLGETSPVNVAAQSDLDLGTRVLDVKTETYYTGNSAATTNKLNVVLMQDNVPGPQTGGATYNPASILPNGDYNHNHMLRHMLTGQWGTNISTTTTGTFYADSMTYTIPANYLGVSANLADMSVAVFVAEGQQVVTTGAISAMNLVTPPGTSVADMTITSNSSTPASLCDGAYTPSVNISNTSAAAIDSTLVSYALNGGTPVTQLVTIFIAAGASTTVSFPQITLTGTNNEITYTYDFATYNTALIDVTSGNNSVVDGGYIFYNSTATIDSIEEDFQNTAIATNSGGFGYSSVVANTIFDNPDNIPVGQFGVFQAVAPATTPVDKCFRMSYASGSFPANSSAAIVFEQVDMSSISSSILTFDYAHALLGTAAECELAVDVSTDCGATWINVWRRNGTTVPVLANAGTVSGAFFYVTNQYENITVDLSSYAGNSAVAVRFKGSKGASGSGNSLYLDNINMSMITDVTSVSQLSELRIMPNPVSDIMNIAFSTEEATDLDIAITNALGQQVQQVATDNFTGYNTMSVNTAALSTGVYFLTIKSAEGIRTERFVVNR
jgi:hypothetical protein